MSRSNMVIITNISKQSIGLQVRQPGSDFYIGEKQARLNPGKSITVPRNHMMPAQLENLVGKHQLSVASSN